MKFSRPHRKEEEETADNEQRHSAAADDDAFTCRPFALSPLSSTRPSSAMINTRVYIRARAPRLQLRLVVREETRVDEERERKEANEKTKKRITRQRGRFARERERRGGGRSKEEHTRIREEERQSGAECGAVVRADGGEEGKREAREGGGMLRSRGNRLPSKRAARSPLFLVRQRPSRLPALALS